MTTRRHVMRISFRQDNFHFRHRNHRQEPNEKKEERQENAESAGERPDIDPGRVEHAPRRRDEVAVQTAHDDDETLEPHPGVHAHADEVNDVDVEAEFLEPKKLRRNEVAEEHADPPVPPIGTENAVIEREFFVLVAAIPRDEKLHRVGVGNDRAGQQNDLRHFVDVLRRDDVLQLVNRARRNQQREHHGEAAEDRARHEIRRENRGVPRWDDGGGEIEGDHAVH